MSVSLYMDVHVPIAITRSLRSRGADILTSQEDGTSTIDDEALLERATTLQRILVTQDQDFLQIGASWMAANEHFSGIVFA